MDSLRQVQTECTVYVDMLICWYILLSSYDFRYIVRRRKVILFGGSFHVNTAHCSYADCLEILEPQDLSRSVQELLYLFAKEP